jgi:hypothetical protein
MSAAERMALHIDELAAQLGVTIDYTYKGSSGGRAWATAKRIRIRPVKSSITYAVALHELGHCAIGRISPRVGRLSEEGAAWKWAMHNANDWTDAMDDKMIKSLESYVSAYQVREKRGRKVRWPGPDDFVWSMVEDPALGPLVAQ